MRLIAAFLQLIRWPNLFFIVITQLLFYFCIFLPVYKIEPDALKISWLVIASVFIAAAGYIINDYFDLNIDHINKPNKNVIDVSINRRWAIALHLILNVAGIIATIFAVTFNKWYLVVANIICITLLWFYSTSLKRRLLVGNIIISLLTAWTILIIFFANAPLRFAVEGNDNSMIKLFRVAFLYAAFAFIISLVREAIKDIQDMKGDARMVAEHCQLLPV